MSTFLPIDAENLIKSLKSNPVRKKHLDLLTEAFFDNLCRNCSEYGGWGLDDKRPFGNSNVASDIAEIVDIDLENLNEDDQEDMVCYLNDLYNDLGPYIFYKWQKLNNKW